MAELHSKSKFWNRLEKPQKTSSCPCSDRRFVNPLTCYRPAIRRVVYVSFGLSFIYTQKVFSLLKYEKEALNKGFKYIAGVDEVGRGPLAGPMVVAAVILNVEKLFSSTNNDVLSAENSLYSRINDSKKTYSKVSRNA
jgi:hypothetical protein